MAVAPLAPRARFEAESAGSAGGVAPAPPPRPRLRPLLLSPLWPELLLLLPEVAVALVWDWRRSFAAGVRGEKKRAARSRSGGPKAHLVVQNELGVGLRFDQEQFQLLALGCRWERKEG